MQLPDHRRLGRELGLFTTDELLGAGFPLWLPAGAAVRAELERYIVDEERRGGYAHVATPALARRELYEVSGHWAHYADDMFPPMRVGGSDLVLRPMNCPHHVLVYRSAGRSYRELPLRIAELGAMYRAERSGVVGGLSRVRAMTLNDGHLFCAPEQVAQEVAGVLRLIRRAYGVLGIAASRYRLSLGGEGGKYVDDGALWGQAEAELRAGLALAGIEAEQTPGEAAFYGPKIDVQVRDPQGREETLSTVQVDLLLPRRFGLTYTGVDGQAHVPVMIHRSVLSTLERLVAHLIEVHGGAFPPWLAPVQAVVLPVGAPGHAQRVRDLLIDGGVRCALDSEGTLAARVRAAQAQRIPYVLVVGAREAEAGTVALRLRDGRRLPPQPLDRVLALLGEVLHRRSPDLLPSAR
jgi:threonyl-tRNA synthetase